MKNSVKKTNVKNTRLHINLRGVFSRLNKWQKRTVIAATLTLITLCTVMLALPSRQIKLNVNVYAPTPSQFTDDVSAAFLSSDNIPDINNNRDLSGNAPLVINYIPNNDEYTDIFRPNITTDDLAKDIKITPFIKGHWYILYDSIKFIPEHEWPADTKFTVRVNKSLFNQNVVPRTYKSTFRTADLTAQVDSFNLYPDPSHPKSMVAIAVISFNYPINTTNFDDKVLLKQDGRKLDFTVKFDRFHRTAFIISAPTEIQNKPQVIRLKLNRIPDQYDNTSSPKLTSHTTLESADNFFKITNLATTVVENADGNIQQLLLINTTAAADQNTKWNKYVQAYLLPRQHPDADEDTDAHSWKSDEITSDILAISRVIPVKPVNFVSPNGIYQYALAFDISETAPRNIYVNIAPGMNANGGFEMQSGMDRILNVPYPNPTVKIAGSGALLSMAGDKKLGIMARGGVNQAYINMYKIKASEINHLVSQTYDLFSNNLDFKSYSFGKYDMATVFQKTIPFANASVTRTNYASLDLGDYLDRTATDKTGLFIIQAGTNRDDVEFGDQRLIMLTDFGIIRKRNQNDTSELFVAQLSTGTPAPDTEISVLGRNGNPIWAGRTDENGHAEIPAFDPSEYKNARQPVAIVARNGDDVTFIPYDADSTLFTEYSKFDIDGEYVSNITPMSALVFSDRGIYRPGESAIIAGIIKNKSFKSLAGIPIKIEILDSRGRETFNRPISLESDGMFDATYNIPESASTGTYTIRIFSLNSKNKIQDMLGSATFNVEEFTPDTMKITANIQSESDDGWISTENIHAGVFLQNLFGTAAADRRITATATLTPTDFTFPEYKNYRFTPKFPTTGGMSAHASLHGHTYSVTLQDTTTDEAGFADLAPDFNQDIAPGTYLLSLNIQGFDKDSGKSVQTNITRRASTSEYLIGFSSENDLTYLKRDAAATVNIIAINNTAKRTSVTDITMRLIKRENLTSLIKDDNGYYKYQTVTRDKTLFSRPISVPESGYNIKLATDTGGTYFLQILDSSDRILANIEYFVATSNNAELQSDTNAEMKIKLDGTSYKPGDDISVNITAPYTGAGLITIERDKVYAYKWFKANSTSFVQTITVPDKFEGTGYVNVAFVRDINSHDIFTSPYSYAVAPFSADISAHKIDVKLNAPEKINSNKLTIEYQTNKNARLMIFAINTGILQVARYKIPNPLSHFFQKSALQVNTYQTLSLLLPEYSILREYAKTGGGDYADLAAELNQILTNPFARKLSKSVAFYSGIISTTANTPGTVTFDIPEEFNGSIKTFAIATDDTAMGSANTQTLVQAPIIISTNMPAFVAPGDKMNVGINIANMTPDSGNDAKIVLLSNTSDNITLIGKNGDTLTVPENTEKHILLTLAANNTPGNAELTINANLFAGNNTQITTRRTISTTSVRPITTYTTKTTTGEIKSATHTVKKFLIPMYPDSGPQKIYISRNANAAIKPLFEYLKHYDFPCSEQIVSRAIPYVLMSGNAFIGTTHEDSVQKISDTINVLKTRQNDDGSFDLWAGGTTDINNTSDIQTAYLTAYVVQFLSLARAKGFTVPKEMTSRAVDYLRTFAGGTITNDDAAGAVAYSIYVITNNGYITTGYINLFEEYANANIKNWQNTIMGAYIAATYKLLKQSDKADTLISKYKMSHTDKFIYKSMFSNNVVDDAMYSYLLSQHFKTAPSGVSAPIQAYLNRGDYSSYTSAIIIMALSGVKSDNNNLIHKVSVSADNTKLSGQIISDTFVAEIPSNISHLTIDCPYCNRDTRLQYAVEQSGFPVQSTPATNGIELVREYYDTSGNRITSASVGDIVTVKIYIRSRGASYMPNVAIIDLMPGGFIPDTDSFQGDTDFTEFREDRIVIYTDITNTNKTLEYRAQIGTSGTFSIPPIHAQSMYNPQINATGTTGTFTVSNASATE